MKDFKNLNLFFSTAIIFCRQEDICIEEQNDFHFEF